MKTFKTITETVDKIVNQIDSNLSTVVLSEALHASIHDALYREEPRYNQKMNIDRNNKVTKIAKKLIANGEDSGLESDKPKKGSSRAVYFPKEKQKINLDGHDVETPSALKIAFPGQLDKHTGDDQLLGEQQNQVESDHFANDNYGVIRKDHETGKWHTKDDGFLPPHFGHHDDHHWLEMGRVDKLTTKGFKEATKHPDYPKGITHQEFYDAVNQYHDQAHGRSSYSSTPKERINEIQDHPLISGVTDFCGNTDNHPADMNKGNMGLWTHPVTGKKHVVLSDFGASKNILKSYQRARVNLSKTHRGY